MDIEILKHLDLNQLPIENQDLGVGGVLIIGLLYCFLGYRIFRWLLALSGGLAAGGLAAFALGYITQGHSVAMAVAGLIGGLCGAVALHFLYRAGVFLLGMVGVALIMLSIQEALTPPSWYLWALLGGMLAGGLLALWIEAPAMRLATAAIGAWLIVAALFALAQETALLDHLNDPGRHPWLTGGLLAALLLLSLTGFAFQQPRRRKEKEKR